MPAPHPADTSPTDLPTPAPRRRQHLVNPLPAPHRRQPLASHHLAVGAFAATEAGIFVSASAGNGGPGGLTVTNVAPWVTTVGAGSVDRDFPADVKLGDGHVLPGVSVYGGPGLAAGHLYPLVYAGAAEGAGDGGSLNTDAVKGKIVLCDRGVNSRAAKGEVVRKAGSIGMILANSVFDGEGLVADCHVLPATAVGAVAGDMIRKYIAAATASLLPQPLSFSAEPFEFS